MSTILAEAVAQTLRLDVDLQPHTFADPPEGMFDCPAAIVLETSAEATRAGYQGLWEAETETRVWALVETRRDAENNINATRPWELRLLALFAANDELLDESGVAFGEITRLRSRVGNLDYGKSAYTGVEVVITARVDVQVAARCSLA
jgi:hypothetical protein